MWFLSAVLGLAVLAGFGARMVQSQANGQTVPSTPASPQLVWIDTDIGDDIDDAFALALILRSPELKVIGISTTFGDTETRARLVDRFLAATAEKGVPVAIPVTAGVHTETDNAMTQRAYAERFPPHTHADGVAALVEAIRRHPGEVTLIAIGPLFNIGAAIDRDPVIFRKLRRVVMMGGSIYRGYDGKNGEHRPADAEWNVLQDPNGAAKLFTSGVPIFMMPLDSTQIHLETAQRQSLFAAGNLLTAQLETLYKEWSANASSHPVTPTLFDPVAAAFTFHPEICPTTPMRIQVDAKGMTHAVEGQPNAEVCLKSDETAFLKLLEGRLTRAGN